MRIQEGQPAKDFNVTDIFGNRIGLADFRGKKLMLSFYRYASCPLCNMRVHTLIENYDKLTNGGLSIVAFFQSPQPGVLQYVGKQNAPFPIVADPDHIVYREYGVESSWFGFMKGAMNVPAAMKAMSKFKPGPMDGKTNLIPADFLIGPDLTVERTYYGTDITDHIPLDDVFKWVGR